MKLTDWEMIVLLSQSWDDIKNDYSAIGNVKDLIKKGPDEKVITLLSSNTQEHLYKRHLQLLKEKEAGDRIVCPDPYRQVLGRALRSDEAPKEYKYLDISDALKEHCLDDWKRRIASRDHEKFMSGTLTGRFMKESDFDWQHQQIPTPKVDYPVIHDFVADSHIEKGDLVCFSTNKSTKNITIDKMSVKLTGRLSCDPESFSDSVILQAGKLKYKLWAENATVYFQVKEMDESFRCANYATESKILVTPSHLLNIESVHSPNLEIFTIYLCGEGSSDDLKLSSHAFDTRDEALEYVRKVYESLQYFGDNWKPKDDEDPFPCYSKEHIHTAGQLQYRLWVDDCHVCFRMDKMDESFRFKSGGDCETKEFIASSSFEIRTSASPEIREDLLYLGGIYKEEDNKLARFHNSTNERAVALFEKIQTALTEFGKRND